MKISPVRRIVQFLSLAGMVAVPAMNLRGINVASGSFYALTIGPLTMSDPLMVIQPLLAGLTLDLALLATALIPAAIALAFGRVFCGWVCPQNTLSELGDFLAARLGHARLFSCGTGPLARYLVLAAILAVTVLFGFPIATLLSAPGIISVQTARLIYEKTVGLELALIGLILFLEFFVLRRIWCNHLCPVGSLLGLLRLKKTMRVAMREDQGSRCIRCRECARACQLGLDPMAGELSSQCHNCGACLDACRKMTGEQKPLVFKF